MFSLSEVMAQIQIWIDQIITAIGYPGITLVMFAENLFPPIPSELVMPFAGFKVANGEYNLVLTILAGTLGSVLGALALYYIGRLAGEPLVRPFFRRFGRFFLLSEEDLDKSLAVFGRHGEVMVFAGRVIPLIRSLISLPAGMNRMPMGRFLLFTTLGSAIWTSFLTVAGVMLGANWERILGFVEVYQDVVLIGIALAVVAFVVVRVNARFRRQPAA